jgi:riboflavin kinase/FMN adenylyltransferase
MLEEGSRRGLPSALFTFAPRPTSVLVPGASEDLLTPFPRKCRLLAEIGVPRVCVLHFTRDFSQLSPEAFLRRFLGMGQGLAGLWVGHDFRFGRGREGDPALLARFASTFGFVFHQIDAVQDGGEPISASRLRTHLRAGEVPEARKLLGRWPDLEGMVVPGQGLGGKLLVATANLDLPAGVCLPAEGVYAGFAEWDGRARPAVMNLGRRPTLTSDPRPVPEVHVLDFAGDLRGRRLLFELRARIRPERKFPSLEALKLQIGKDIEAARRALTAG